MGYPRVRGDPGGGAAPVLESPASREARSIYFTIRFRSNTMGKGDRKTAKGKRYNASYGNARPHAAVTKAAGTAAAPVVKKAAGKSVAKKAVKKTAA
jgi:30S ribosomal protein S31